MRLVTVARKPLSESNVASNVLLHGCGALNINASRLATTENLNGGAYGGDTRQRIAYSATDADSGSVVLSRLNKGLTGFVPPSGRWPANLILQHRPECRREHCVEGCPIPDLDVQSGNTRQGHFPRSGSTTSMFGPNNHAGGVENNGFGDVGGASRYFKQIK